MSGEAQVKISEVSFMCNNNGLCGCLNNNWWWIIILILLFCNCGNGTCGNSGCGNWNDCDNNRCGCGC